MVWRVHVVMKIRFKSYHFQRIYSFIKNCKAFLPKRCVMSYRGPVILLFDKTFDFWPKSFTRWHKTQFLFEALHVYVGLNVILVYKKKNVSVTSVIMPNHRRYTVSHLVMSIIRRHQGPWHGFIVKLLA